jgi:thiamine transport system ATP-binding protein
MLQVEDVVVRFGQKAALDGVSLGVGDGEVVTVLGASGAGKSTLLRVIAGLTTPDRGRILLEGEDLASVPPHRRGIGLVFQDHALFPHRDVAGNVAFGLRMRGASREEIDRRVGEVLALVGLAGFERRSVATLSGGEQQRVALARSLAPEPRILLLDEPLGSLDRRLRDRLLTDLERLFAELRVTGLYVTHDQAEAFALGDRVAVMRDGIVVQLGTPDELWARPVDEDIARFLGLGVLDGKAIRPEAVVVQAVLGHGRGDGVVTSVARHGPTVRLEIRLDAGGSLSAAMTSLDHPRAGDRVSVQVESEGIVSLPPPG